jgi:hypothetical protein
MRIICNEDTLAKIDRRIGAINTDNNLVLRKLEGQMSERDHLYHGLAIFGAIDDETLDRFSLQAILDDGGYEGVSADIVGTTPLKIKRLPISLTKEELKALNEHRGQLCTEEDQILVKIVTRLKRGKYEGHLEFCDPQPDANPREFSLLSILAKEENNGIHGDTE